MRPKPKLSVLEKKIQPNPRYRNVEPVINTGTNLRTELERLEELHQLYKFRSDEVFRRVTVDNLVSLMIEVNKLEYQLRPSIREEKTVLDGDTNGSVVLLPGQGEPEGIEGGTEFSEPENIDTLIRSQFEDRAAPGNRHVGTARSITSVAMGVGELDVSQVPVPAPGPDYPFLILDVREPDLFARSHLALARSYPAIRLNRAFDYETKEMLRVKNRERSILVLYDDDETTASRCASTLTQRGYDNVFMLSGGLRVAGLRFPESLVTDKAEEEDRLEEGDIIVLERQLEENLLKGTSRISGSKAGSSRYSSSLDRGAIARQMIFDAPIRTSTALGKLRNK